MDYYRVTVTAYGTRRTMDVELGELEIVTREARQAGFQVSFVLVPRGAELMPGVLVEPVDLQLN